MRKCLTLLALLFSPLVFLASFLALAFTLAATMLANVFKKEKQTLSVKEKPLFEQWEGKRRFVELRDIEKCSVCSEWLRASFATESDFLELDLHLKQAAFKHLQRISGGFSNPKHEFLGVGIGGRILVGADIYLCTKCGQKWELSIPDMAYRGYFIPIEETSPIEGTAGNKGA
jgi:hypothetical protein